MRRVGSPKPRSAEMVLAGYFLSRLTTSSGGPPASLGALDWASAYDRFHTPCGDGRPPEVFRNSLKNLRDAFDAYFPNRRKGWLSPDGSPAQLGAIELYVFRLWKARTDVELEGAIADLLEKELLLGADSKRYELVPGQVLKDPPRVAGFPDVDGLLESTRRSRDSKRVGDTAELEVMAYLSRTLSPDEADTLIHHAAVGEAPGYQISHRSGRLTVAIAVKGTSGEMMTTFLMSAHEWAAAEEYGELYRLYLVSGVGSDMPRFEVLRDPVGELGRGLRRRPLVYAMTKGQPR